MGDLRELAVTVVILVIAFLASPLAIDRVAILAEQPSWVKIILCFAFSGLVFVATVVIWAAVSRLIAAILNREERGPKE